MMKTTAPWVDLRVGDSREVLLDLPAGLARCCVTSPPYWRMRDYGMRQQIGLEKSPEVFVAQLVAVFRAVRRVLTDDGTLWLNIGDSYACSGKGSTGKSSGLSNPARYEQANLPGRSKTGVGLKRKDLVGIPWMLAFALRADGWYLRSDIIWHKPSPVPESITDRPTKAHEHVFLLSKSTKYFYDAAAIGESFKGPGGAVSIGGKAMSVDRSHVERSTLAAQPKRGWANARDVWTIASQPFAGAHFAPMPGELARRCILAGSAVGDIVLDPFMGSGTVGMEAVTLGRSVAGIEINPKYLAIADQRMRVQRPLLAAGGGS
jgi:DNA modification methylase